MENKFTEKELLLDAQNSEEAFEELYKKYHQLVYYVAFKLCKNDADAQDVVQETFVEIKRSLADLKNPQYFRLWLYRVIDSKCKKLFRKNKYSFTDLEQDYIQNEFKERDLQYLPSAQLKFKSDQELLHHFIDMLPYDQKFAVILYYMEQMTTLEIANLLQIPEGTVKSRLSVARATLRKRIEAYEHREGIKLNFHDLGAALCAAFAVPVVFEHTEYSTTRQAKNTRHGNLSSEMVGGFAIKAFAAICIGLCAMGGIAVFMNSGNGSQDSMTQERTTYTETNRFPSLTYYGKMINNSRDAYYTLKMNICMQDIATLTKSDRAEADPLYQALKEENGVYYQRLLQSGWAKEYEK